MPYPQLSAQSKQHSGSSAGYMNPSHHHVKNNSSTHQQMIMNPFTLPQYGGYPPQIDDFDPTDQEFLLEAFADVEDYGSSLNSMSDMGQNGPHQHQYSQPHATLPTLSVHAARSNQHGIDNDYMPLSMFAGVAVPFPDQNLYELQQNKQQLGSSFDPKKFKTKKDKSASLKRPLKTVETKVPKKQKFSAQTIPLYPDSEGAERKEPVSAKSLHAAAAKEKRRERNKVLARKTRCKKREELDLLREQVEHLQSENDKLRVVVKSRQALTVSESSGSTFGSESDDNEANINFDIQLPENVVNMVQMVIARAESIDCSQAGVSKYARKAFCITNATAPDNPIVHASPGFMELTGYDMHSILGHNCRFLQGPETDRNEARKLRIAIEQGREEQVIIKNYRRDGTTFWSRVQIGPMRDASGKITLIVGVQCEVDAPTTDNHASTSGSGSSGGSTDGRGSSSSSDDGNGCSWNGSTISGGSGCMSNNDTRSEGSQDDVSEGGTNDETNEEEYVPS